MYVRDKGPKAPSIPLNTKSKTTTMRGGNIKNPIGSDSFGKVVEKPGIGKWAYTSGQVGTNSKGVLVSKNPASQAK